MVLDKDLVVYINIIVVLNKDLVKILESCKLYGESTVSFTLCLSGSTHVSSPHTLLMKFWEVLRYTANLQFPSPAVQVKSTPVYLSYTLWFVFKNCLGLWLGMVNKF